MLHRRRYEYPVTVRMDTLDSLPDGEDRTPFRRDFLTRAIRDALVNVGNIDVIVGEPVDITSKSAADRAEAAVRSELYGVVYNDGVDRLAAAVRAAVGEETP